MLALERGSDASSCLHPVHPHTASLGGRAGEGEDDAPSVPPHVLDKHGAVSHHMQ